MGDFGVKLTLPGNDISTASDAELLFNSTWPNIKIAFNETINNITATSLSNNGNVIYQHNLGFIPAFIPYTGTTEADINTLNTLNIASVMTADTENIYFTTLNPPSTIRLLIFYLDLLQPFTAPIIQTGQSSTATPDPNWGFKISKNTRDTNSNDMRNFILHSSCRSPMVHAVIQGVAKGLNGFSYTHDLPYNPIFFAYTTLGGGVNTEYAFTSSSLFGVTTQGNTITMSGSALGDTLVSIVILQDPFIITDNILTVSV